MAKTATRQVKRREPQPSTRFAPKEVVENKTAEGVWDGEPLETIEEPVVISDTAIEDLPKPEPVEEVVEPQRVEEPVIEEPVVKEVPKPKKQNVPWYVNRAMGIDDYYNW